MKTALVLLLIVGLAASMRASEPGWTPKSLWDGWKEWRLYKGDPYALRHEELVEILKQRIKESGGLLAPGEAAVSCEGRTIGLYSFGLGPRPVLLWSQMHGDEPTATVALLDVLNFLSATWETPETERLRRALTLHVIPMLNPDGAERLERRNAQGIDVNRDAARLETPEGRFLKAVRDRLEPKVGFNLHNQSAYVTAGPAGPQTAIALLSVPFDETFQENEGRRLTKRLAVRIEELLSPFVPGRISRYDTEYTARAFGDSLTRWGTPTLLLETGGLGGKDEAETLVRLNFVAILGALQSLSDGSLEAIDPKRYDAIPLNARDRLFDVVVRNATILNGRGLPPFRADLGINRKDAVHTVKAGLADLGDLTTSVGKEEIDGASLVATPAPEGGEAALKALFEKLRAKGTAEGAILTLEGPPLVREVAGWAGPRGALTPGFPGDVLLFKKDGGRLRLERVIVGGEVRPAPSFGPAAR